MCQVVHIAKLKNTQDFSDEVLICAQDVESLDAAIEDYFKTEFIGLDADDLNFYGDFESFRDAWNINADQYTLHPLPGVK